MKSNTITLTSQCTQQKSWILNKLKKCVFKKVKKCTGTEKQTATAWLSTEAAYSRYDLINRKLTIWDSNVQNMSTTVQMNKLMSLATKENSKEARRKKADSKGPILTLD